MSWYQKLCLKHCFCDDGNLYISLYFTSVSLLIMRSQSASIAWAVKSTAAFCRCSSYGTFCFMNWMCCIYLILAWFVLMRYANLFELWFDKRQRCRLLLPMFDFWKGDWALGSEISKFEIFLIFPYLLRS